MQSLRGGSLRRRGLVTRTFVAACWCCPSAPPRLNLLSTSVGPGILLVAPHVRILEGKGTGRP